MLTDASYRALPSWPRSRKSSNTHMDTYNRKLPGGYVDLGEEFGAAACREVEEETGVMSTFRSLLSIRHQHNVSFGRSDMCVVPTMTGRVYW